MTDGPPLVLHRTSPAARTVEDETDRHLLERFVSGREESAFAALVARHGASVLGVCRRVLRHEQDAEDASQATFLVLARKAGAVRWECSIKSWLHAVAYRLALGARSSSIRRSLLEKPIDSLPEKSHPLEDALVEVGRRELQRVIEDELAGLPEKYQAPVILCYLEGKTNEEAADQLGWPSGSMSGRLARARAILRQRCCARGLAFLLLLLGIATLIFFFRERETPVARAMAPFRPVSEGGEGIGRAAAAAWLRTNRRKLTDNGLP